MWVIDQMTPGNPATTCRSDTGARPAGRYGLGKKFNEIIKRHEGLRTTFGVKDGEPAQFIHPPPQAQYQPQACGTASLERGEREINCRLCLRRIHQAVLTCLVCR